MYCPNCKYLVQKSTCGKVDLHFLYAPPGQNLFHAIEHQCKACKFLFFTTGANTPQPTMEQVDFGDESKDPVTIAAIEDWLIQTASPDWLWPDDAAILQREAEALVDGNLIVEVGSGQAKSTGLLLLATRNKLISVISIDPWTDSADFKSIWWRNVARLPETEQHRLFHLEMTSEEAAAGVTDSPNMVYVDGDHGKEAVKLDLELWGPKLAPGGVIVMHDYHQYGIKPALDEFLAENNEWDFKQEASNMAVLRRREPA